MSLVGKGRFSNAVVALQIELGALLVLVVLLQSSSPLWEPLRPVEGQRAFESGAPILCRVISYTVSHLHFFQRNEGCLVVMLCACECSHFLVCAKKLGQLQKALACSG